MGDDAGEGGGKVRYPLSVIVVYLIFFAERTASFSAGGVKTLYMKQVMGFSDDDTTVFHHLFTFLMILSIFGAMISDSKLGKYKSVLLSSGLHTLGNVLLLVSSLPLGIPNVICGFTGFLVVTLGKCIWSSALITFGADQFGPTQKKQQDDYFSILYMIVNVAGILAGVLAPALRTYIRCFGRSDCYAIVFAVCTCFSICHFVVLILTVKCFKPGTKRTNVSLRIFNCTAVAINKKIVRKRSEPAKPHWLDYAVPTYDQQLVDDVKQLYRLSVFVLPMLFWNGLFDQMESTWTLQGVKMDGVIGKAIIDADMMTTINSILILIMIPLFQKGLYPLIARIKIDKPLRKMIVGLLLMVVGYVIAGFLDMWINSSIPAVPSAGTSQMRVYNGAPCSYSVNIKGDNIKSSIQVPSKEMQVIQDLKVEGSVQTVFVNADAAGNCISIKDVPALLFDESSSALYIGKDGSAQIFQDSVEKDDDGNALLTVLGADSVLLRLSSKPKIDVEKKGLEGIDLDEFLIVDEPDMIFEYGTYYLYLDGKEAKKEVDLKLGGVYTILADVQEDSVDYKMLEVIKPNTVHILWQTPQYILLTSSEVMFNVVSISFLYAEAPESLEAALQTLSIVGSSLGQVMVMIVTKLPLPSMAITFFFYAALMALGTGLMLFLGLRYKPKDPEVKVI